MAKSRQKIDRKAVELVLLMLLGLAILLYPTVSNLWNQYRANRLITEYSTAIETHQPQADLQKWIDQAREYNAELVQTGVKDSFSSADDIHNAEYERQLNPYGNGMMGYIRIPSISVNIPLYHYTSEPVLNKGAGHLFGTTLPVGGEDTHAILSAHRGLPEQKLFTDLNLVRKGDTFYIEILHETLAYEVDKIETVLPTQTQSLLDRTGDKVTLVTCTPYGVNSHRLLVTGHRVPYEKGQEKAVKSRARVMRRVSTAGIIASIAVGILIASVIFQILDRRAREKDAEKRRSDAGDQKGNETRRND